MVWWKPDGKLIVGLLEVANQRLGGAGEIGNRRVKRVLNQRFGQTGNELARYSVFPGEGSYLPSKKSDESGISRVCSMSEFDRSLCSDDLDLQ